MKKTLFVLQSVRAGGSATSMLNLLELYSQKGIKYDLFLLEHDGIFLDRAKACSVLLPEETIVSSVLTKKENLKSKGLMAYFIRCLFVLSHKLFGEKRVREFFYKLSAKKLKGYDTVVAYQESIATEYAQHIPAGKRVAWCHTAYEAFTVNMSKQYLQRLYDKFDEIACVSVYAKNSMLSNLRLDENKVHVVHNTVPAENIVLKSKEPIPEIEKHDFVFTSMGRFVGVKRFDRIVYAAEVLNDRGVDFVWYILGDGEAYDTVKKLVSEKRLEARVRLLGVKKNPFPYIAASDCYVLTSESEAQPMALNEALTLAVPVISTDFASSREVVTDMTNGLIVENSGDGVASGVIRFVTAPDLRIQLKNGAKTFHYDNESILRQVDSILHK